MQFERFKRLFNQWNDLEIDYDVKVMNFSVD